MSRKLFKYSVSLILILAMAAATFTPASAFPPSNDDFTNAVLIASLPFSQSVDITEATTEPNEPQACFWINQSIWFSFTPIETMAVHADTQGSAIGSVLNVYAAGSGISDLQFLDCATPGNSINFHVEAGQTYYLQAGSGWGESGNIQVNLTQIYPPQNDDFSNAAIIGSLPFSVVVDITNATNEPGEPQYCYGMPNTVWYAFTPTQTMVVRVDTQGSTFGNNLNVYHASGSGISDLQFMGCVNYGGSISFLVEAGQTYYLQAGGTYGDVGSVQINLEQIPAPSNDNFADATLITSLSSPIEFDTTAATFESNEPVPPCAYGPPFRTIWFSFTSSDDWYLSASIPSANFNSFVAVYSGTDLNNLTQLGCSQYNNILTFHAIPGQIYTFQVSGFYGMGGIGIFLLEPPPPPVANFYFSPYDPSRFDTIQFNDGSYDPAALGFQTFEWNFGDGATASGSSVFHKYAVDGDYQVSYTVTTVDGRTASITQTVQVRTHDVSVAKVAAPKAAASGQTSAIVVFVRSLYYPETVSVDLYRSVPGGSEWINNLTLPVPVSSGNRTTNFSFSYTFTAQDAQIGKVTFRAVANLMSVRDAFPQDNTGISSPTRISR